MTNQDLQITFFFLLFFLIAYLCGHSWHIFSSALNEIIKVFEKRKQKIPFKFYLIICSTFISFNALVVVLEIKFAEKIIFTGIIFELFIVSSFLASVWEFFFKWWLHKAKQSST